MRFFPEEGYKRVFAALIYAFVGILLLILVFRYLLPALLPFCIAFFLAALLAKPTEALAARTKIPRKLLSPVLAVLPASGILAGSVFLVWKLIEEIGAFARAVVSGENPLLENLQNMLAYLSSLIEKLPFASTEHSDSLRGTVTDAFFELFKNFAASLGTNLPSLAAKLAAAIPNILLFCVVTVLASVYFCAEYDRIRTFFEKNLHGKAKTIFEKLRHAAGTTLLRVLRSYAVLFLFTFAELLLGFVILREPYALLLAFLTALVDSLPVFGTGAVLLPMAIYRFFTGDIRAAIGFCILYGIVTILRQILEPKILGDGIGMHPLLMLMSMYAGFKLFGVLGMILLPIGAIILKNMMASLRQNGEVAHDS